MNKFLVALLVLFLLGNALICYCALIVASRADEKMNEILRKSEGNI